MRSKAGLGLGLCLLFGCQSVPDHASLDSGQPSRGYFDARWNDLKRAISLRVGVGPGLGARLSVTKALQAGLMYIGPSEPYGEILKLKSLYLGNVGEDTGVWDVRSVEYGVSTLYHYEDDVLGYRPPEQGWRGSYEERPDTALDAAVHLGLVGVQFTFDPWSFVKFFGGVFGFGEAGWGSEPSAEASDLG